MLNFKQISDKISDKGFRRCTTARTYYDEEGNPIKVYDFEHRRKLDMFSIYLDGNDLVQYVEYTKVTFDQGTRRYSQQVRKIDNTKELLRFLA